MLFQAIPAEEMAEHAYIAAGLQIHFARRAAALDPERLQRIEDGVVPPAVVRRSLRWSWAGRRRTAPASLKALALANIGSLLAGSCKRSRRIRRSVHRNLRHNARLRPQVANS